MTHSKLFPKKDFRFTAEEMTNGLYLVLVLDKVKELMGNVDISAIEDHHIKLFNKGVINFVEYATSGVWGFGLKKGTDFDDLLPVDGLSEEFKDEFWDFIYKNDKGWNDCNLEGLKAYYDMVDELESDYNAWKREMTRSRFYNSEE